MIKWSARNLSWDFNPIRPGIFGALLCALALQARAATLDVNATAGGNCSTLPGQIVTLSWRLANRADDALLVRERYELPADWRLTAVDDSATRPIALAPRAMILRFAALLVPAHALAGSYPIVGHWTTTGDQPIEVTASYVVTVQTRERLELAVRKAPGMAIAGEAYTVDFLATNRGNAPLRVRATGTPPTAATAIAYAPAEFTLAPGASAPVQARVTTAPTLARREFAPLDTTLTTTTGLAAHATALTEVFPAPTNDRTGRWPSRLETRFVRQPGGRTLAQATLNGSTQSDEGRQFSYFLRSAGEKGGGYFDEPELYSFDYRGPRWSWQAGNHTYALSPLTARPQFGSGAAVTMTAGETWTAGLLAMRSRENASVERQIGAFARAEVTPNLTVTVNALEKTPGCPGFRGREHRHALPRRPL